MTTNNDAQLSDRIEALKRKARASDRDAVSSQRPEIFRRVLRETPSEPRAIRLATALAAFLREKDLLLREDDLLAGNGVHYDFSLPDDEEPPTVFLGRDFIVGRRVESSLPEEVRKAYRVRLFGTYMGGHVIAGYDRVLASGLGALTEAARKRSEASTGAGHDFAAACLIASEAATDYVRRYAAKAQQLARQATRPEYAQSLERIADTCRWVAVNPPRGFFDAVQLLWLTHEIVTCEQPAASVSLGRLDQYLFPYYAADAAAGALTRDEAAELIEALWLKFAALRGSFQNVVLGGGGPDGGCAANDLSYLCLRATRRLQMDQPLVSVRWCPGMPDEFWNEVLKTIEVGIGFPALFNDEVAIPAKARLGIPVEDARDYAVVGCVELSIPGKEFSHTEALRVNWAKVLELMLNGGTCTVTGETMQLKKKQELERVASFDQFYQWYRDELAHFVDLGIRGMNILDRDFSKYNPYPFLSSTMTACLESGRDATAGGAAYNFSSVNGCGMANAADSLAAIKKMVYDDKKVSLTQIAEAVRSDFQDADGLRRALLRCPKCGNDDDGPDGILKDLAESFCRRVDGRRNPRGGRFQAGLYTVDWHAVMGKRTGALPDGRRRGLALANGLSPAQGADVLGPTAVINSITKLDHRALGNGMVLDLKFHPAFFDDEKRRQAFRHLIETYFRLGGLEVQFNVVSRDTLLAAQARPETHRDFIVRVSGFSAYFVDLDKVCQDEIIARTEQAPN